MVTTIKKRLLEDKPTNPQFINPTTPNKTGYGVRTPEGEDITGLTADQAFSLKTNYKKPKLSEDEQIAEDYARNQKAIAYAKSQEPEVQPILNPNQQASLEQSLTGTIDVTREQTTRDINAMNTAAEASQQDLMGVLPLNKFSGAAIKTLNKFGDSGAGNVLLSFAPQRLKNYLNQYSNGDSVDKINTRVADAKASVDYALSLSNNPETAVEGAELFETSIRSIRIAQAQLRLTTQRKGYDKDTDLKLIEINNYLEKIAPNKLKQLQLSVGIGVQ